LHPHKTRLIVISDTKNEADDQFAVVHALLTPSFDIEGLVAAHFGTERSARSMEASREEIDRLTEMMGVRGRLTVENGSESPISDEVTPAPSGGSELIVRSGMRDDDRQLVIACLGPLTDFASALLMEPRLSTDKIRVIWIGGGPWPEGGWEFNLGNDIAAANVVFRSAVELIQIPRPVFNRMPVSYAELEAKVGPCGVVGRYLVDEVYRFNRSFYERPMEYRPLADSAAIGVAMHPDCGDWTLRPAPQFAPDMRYLHVDGAQAIRVFDSIDSRFILEDFFAKLRRYAQTGDVPIA
jgi:purine nucleosidase